MNRALLLACPLAVLAIAMALPAQGYYFVQGPAITELNFTGSDTKAPALQGDELYIVFASNRPGGLGDYDLWQATRASITATWSAPTNLVTLNTTAADSDPHLTCDGLTLFFASSRAGGLGTTDLYVSQRPSRGSPWGPPQNLGPAINGAGIANTCPGLTVDGLGLFFTSDRSGNLDLWNATRPSTAAAFGAPVAFAAANSAFDDHSSVIEGNGELVWFASNRPGGPAGDSDYWLVCKDPTTGVYGPPEPIADLSTANTDGHYNRGCSSGMMYTSTRTVKWILERRCPRIEIVTTDTVGMSRTQCIQVSAAPPRYIVRRIYATIVTTTPLIIPLGAYRWLFPPNAAAAVTFGSVLPLSAPVPVNLVLPGSEGFLMLSNLVTLSVTALPPFTPPALLTTNFLVPGNPALAGIDVHFQTAVMDLVLLNARVSEPTTLELR